MRLTGTCALPAVLLAVLATACGSTVQYKESVSGAQAQQQGLGDPAAPGQSAGAGIASGQGSGTGSGIGSGSGSGIGSGQGTGQGAAGQPVATQQPGSNLPLASTGRGVTATTVTLGIAYAVNAGTANAAFGGQGITTGNEPADARAVIAEINKHGGLLGRTIVPLFYERDAQSTTPVAQQAQRECSFFTDDHKVFATLLGNGPIDWAEKPCLNKVGVPAITSHIVSLDDGDPRLSSNVDVAGMSELSLATAQLRAIESQKWLNPWNSTTGAPGTTPAKVGLVSYDLPAVNHAVDQVLLPGLKRLGHAVEQQNIYRIAVPQATSDDASAEAALQNAMLKMRSNNVDHVVVVDNGGAMTLLFANNLYSQRYFPRLAGTSSNGFQALLTGGSIQPQVLHGLVGAGWEPVIDLPFTVKQASPARASCQKLMRAAGQTFSDANSEAVALGYCDKLTFLQAAVKLAGALTSGAYLSAIDRLGSFTTARGLGSTFGPGRHDGGNAFRDMLFDTGCGCVAYSGPTRTVT
jgi:hypothetical protein